MKSLYRFLHSRKMFSDLTEQEFSWVLYDVGNSAFTMLACSLLPIWFKGLAVGDGPGQISGNETTAFYSASISIVTLRVFAQVGGNRSRDGGLRWWDYHPV